MPTIRSRAKAKTSKWDVELSNREMQVFEENELIVSCLRILPIVLPYFLIYQLYRYLRPPSRRVRHEGRSDNDDFTMFL